MSATANKLRYAKISRTTAINKIDELVALATSAKGETSLRTLFKMRHKHIQNIYDDFYEHHNCIMTILSTQENVDASSDEEIRIDFDKKYYNVEAVYDDLFGFNAPSMSQNTDPGTSRNDNVKLPKINIPIFSGDLLSWPTFYGLFKSLIHDKVSISNCEKFHYLLSYLDKEPLLLVKNLPVTNDNYITAYNALLQRYQNKRLLASHYFDKLTDIPKVTSDNPRFLRNLVDVFTDNVNALKNLGYDTNAWDFVLFRLLIRKVDQGTVKRFELQFNSVNDPRYSDLTDFLSKQCTAFESVSNMHNSQKTATTIYKRPNNIRFSSSTLVANADSKNKCLFCRNDHLIYNCPTFLSKTPKDRYNIIKEKRYCTNCFGTKHNIRNCNSSSLCRMCQQRHHTLLHFGRSSGSSEVQQLQPPPSENISQPTSPDSSSSQNSSGISMPLTSRPVQLNTLTNSSTAGTVLLSTALVEVLNVNKHYETVRILLDCASQLSFVTEKCAKRLGLPRSNLFLSVHGLGHLNTCSPTKSICCKVRPKGQEELSFTVNAAVLPKICGDMPTSTISIAHCEHLSNLQLADPTFNVSNSVDMLLGADVFSQLLRHGRISGAPGEPSAMNTIFGWIVMGKVENTCSNTFMSIASSFIVSSESCLDDTLKKFWELEEIPRKSYESPDDVLCEQMFVETHTRDSSGRFEVTLPFRGPEPMFNNSYQIALRRFLMLERRLIKDPELYREYSAFMREYLDCNHMELVQLPDTRPLEKTYVIPHHCVLKLDSSTTKLRVVFDASCKAPISLNETLFTGPKLQKDIVSILMHFRLNAVVFTADIKQMYRQILVASHHRDYQRILWRFSPDKDVQTYRLKTVTYGVSSSPFLAIRTLIQLATESQNEFPLAAEALRKFTYVDDVICSCKSLYEAENLRSELISLLQTGGFHLRKWASNNSVFLSALPPDDCQQNSLSFDNQDSTIKILGLIWHSSTDQFKYDIAALDRPCTKRTILSELARIFDPLGFLSPLTFFAKHLIQYLWTLGLQWDEIPPSDVLQVWFQYKKELKLLSDISIPRHAIPEKFSSVELHGFADSSEKGFASVVYLRFTMPDGQVRVSLICGKSKVAPLKRISLPRLELCAAVLLSDLMKFVLNSYGEHMSFSQIFAWTDSMVVLSWVKSSSHRWATFVSNRITHIQDNISPEHWHHVSTHDNPSDCASRGLLPSQLVSHPLWWSGPRWLHESSFAYPSSTEIVLSQSSSLALKKEERNISLPNFVSLDALSSLMERFSSLPKIKRIVAYILRFLYNVRHPNEKKVGPFTQIELHDALMLLVKRVQHSVFSQEMSHIEEKLHIPKYLRKLNPFLRDNILRVGGRLSHSGLSYDHKHPAILPRSHRLTELIIEDMHRQYLHPGVQTLQFLLTQQFWILNPRRAIRHTLAKCLKCFRVKPSSSTPLMGDLPHVRVNQVKPFQCVGVDYAGPYLITLSRNRGVKSQKAYLCLFICLAVKAVHLELVSDLTTEAFLAALRRFIARRGRCSKIVSDRGTNFVGAKRELAQLMQAASETENIVWSFNPPSAAHFGGIWEANIKSVKTHLTRILGEQILSYEEFYTVLVQIEAVLNSRPLCPMSPDPNDLSALTPGHFLTLEPLTSLPSPDFSDLSTSHLNRWQLLQQLHQSFWKRWHNEYLQTLQQRHKWDKNARPIEPGMLVLIKNEQEPPQQWRLARVLQTHPGRDGITRVVTLKTAKGQLQRPVIKLCPLPIYNN